MIWKSLFVHFYILFDYLQMIASIHRRIFQISLIEKEIMVCPKLCNKVILTLLSCNAFTNSIVSSGQDGFSVSYHWDECTNKILRNVVPLILVTRLQLCAPTTPPTLFNCKCGGHLFIWDDKLSEHSHSLLHEYCIQ